MVGLDWIGLDCKRLGWCGKHLARSRWTAFNTIELNKPPLLGCAGLDSMGLGFIWVALPLIGWDVTVGSDRIGLKWMGSVCIASYWVDFLRMGLDEVGLGWIGLD